MNHHQLHSLNDSNARSLFGLTRAQLGELLAAMLPALYERRHKQQLAKPNRKRAPGAGRRRSLTPTQEVLLTLVYLRHNVAHCVCGQLFSVSADKSENTFHEVVALLRDICPSERWDAEKRWKKGEPSWRPDEVDYVLIDSFETSVPRPSEPTKQRRLYSGKKKQHTLKTQVITDKQGEILSINAGHPGPLSDKRLWEKTQEKTNEKSKSACFPNATKQADLAYIGAKGVIVPHKRKNRRNQKNELTPEQKDENRKRASERVYVEHGIRRIKAWKILRANYRLATGLFPMIASAVVGLIHLTRLCP
jgi:hypothetical protein